MKKMNLKYQYTGIILLMLLTQSLTAGDAGRGGYAGSFLRMGLGARQLALGSSAVSLDDNQYAAYYNPAGLAFLNHRSVTATLNQMALDRRITYLGFATSLGNSKGDKPRKKGMLQAGFAIGWLSAGVDNIDSRGYDGEDLGTLSAAEHCFYFSFALKPGPKVAIGMNAKLLYNRFPEIADDGSALSATGFGFDVACLIKPVEPLSIGLSVRDLRSKYTWDSQELYERGTQTVDAFLKVLQAGASWRFKQYNLMLTCDVEKVDYYPAELLAGLEWLPIDNAALRCGIQKGSPAFGAGYRLSIAGRFFEVDYAFASASVAPSPDHILTWTCLF